MASVTNEPSVAREVSFEEYMAMPVTNQHVEVVDGVVLSMPTPTVRHQRVQLKLTHSLDEFAIDRDLGLVVPPPFDVVIGKHPKLRIRQPDVLFFSNVRAGFRILNDLERIQREDLKPDLVVEVLSPRQNEITLREKLADYASILVEEVWFADQEAKTIRVLSLDGDVYRLAGEFKAGDRVISAVLAGIDLDVSAVFA